MPIINKPIANHTSELLRFISIKTVFIIIFKVPSLGR